MELNSNDVVCRFVRPDKKRYWDEGENRPKQRAFHDKGGLSIWHEERLIQLGATFDDLKIDDLEKHGQAHHFTGDYFHFAKKAADQNSDPAFSIDIVWRPEGATPPWRQWKDAHFEVDIPDPNPPTYLLFRQLLAANSRSAIAPDFS